MWETFYTLCLPLPVAYCLHIFPLLTSLPVFHSHFLFIIMNMSRHFADCITIELRLVIYLLALHLINFLCNFVAKSPLRISFERCQKNSVILFLSSPVDLETWLKFKCVCVCVCDKWSVIVSMPLIIETINNNRKVYITMKTKVEKKTQKTAPNQPHLKCLDKVNYGSHSGHRSHT